MQANRKNLIVLLVLLLMGSQSLLKAQNVGIGTPDPDQKLEVFGAGHLFTRITSSNNSNVGLQLYRPGVSNRDYQILNEGGTTLRFSSALDLGVSALVNHLNIDGPNNEVEVPGKLVVGALASSHKATIRSLDDRTLRLMGPDGTYQHGARLNFGDANNVYLDEDEDDKLAIYASNRLSLMGGYVGVGTLNPHSEMEIFGVAPELRIRSNSLNNQTGIMFDYEADPTRMAAIVHEHKANRRALHLLNNGDSLLTMGSGLRLWPKSCIWSIITGHIMDLSTGTPIPTFQPGFTPSVKGVGYLGTTQQYWSKAYIDDAYSLAGPNWWLLDTYDDLALLNRIEADTFWNPELQHHIMVMKPETLPAPILKKTTNADGSPGEIFFNHKKTFGLLIGSARQLDQQTKERDRRLAERTRLMAEVLDIDFSEPSTIKKQVSDQGSAQTQSSEVRVTFSPSFQAQLNSGQAPIIHITPRSWYQQYMVDSVDAYGFTLKVKMDPSEAQFAFNWQAQAEVIQQVEVGEEKLDDVFYKRPIVIEGSYPELNERAQELARFKEAETRYREMEAQKAEAQARAKTLDTPPAAEPKTPEVEPVQLTESE